MVPVIGTGMTQNDARRNAIQVARSLHRIMDPVALNDHEVAVRQRLNLVREHQPPMPNLNNSVPFWRQRETVPCYCDK
jgi:hypothetical protein